MSIRMCIVCFRYLKHFDPTFYNSTMNDEKRKTFSARDGLMSNKHRKTV